MVGVLGTGALKCLKLQGSLDNAALSRILAAVGSAPPERSLTRLQLEVHARFVGEYGGPESYNTQLTVIHNALADPLNARHSIRTLEVTLHSTAYRHGQQLLLDGTHVWKLLEVPSLTSFTVRGDSRALGGDGPVQFADSVRSRAAATGYFVRSLSLFVHEGYSSIIDLPGITDAPTLERVLAALTTVAPPTLTRFQIDASTSETPELTAAFRAFFAHQCELREVGVSQSQSPNRTLAPVTDSFCHGLLCAGPHLDTITLASMPSRYVVFVYSSWSSC